MERYNFTNPLFLFKIKFMIRRFYIIFCLAFLVACDDGDILNIELAFSQDLERCDNDVDSYLLYDTRTDPNESLTLLIPKNEQTDAFFTIPSIDSLTINRTTIRFNYRTYNRAIGNEELCDVIPPFDLTVVEDYEATQGTVKVTTTIEDDDNDGISSEDEGRDPNGDGDFSDALNSDGDAFADYLDEDDDNDNVKTKFEIDLENADGDDNPFTEPLDTDGDGIADYLDDDDDGDGIETRLEDEELAMDPRDIGNFVVDENGINIYRYLYNHPTAMEAFSDSGFIFNLYTRSVTTSFIIENADLEIINATIIDFGAYKDSFDISNDPNN